MSKHILLPLLKSTRTEAELTQEELANMTGITEKTIQAIESGIPASLSTAESIASALSLPSYSALTKQHKKERKHLKPKFLSGSKTLEAMYPLDAQALLFSFTFLIMAILFIQAEGFMLAIGIAGMKALTILSVALLTVEPKIKAKTRTTSRPTMGTWVVLLGLLITAQIFAVIFAIMSTLQSPDYLSAMGFFRAYHASPGMTSWLSWVERNPHMIWIFSGCMVLVSLLAIQYSIHRERLRGVSFSGFSEAYIITYLLGFSAPLFFSATFSTSSTLNFLIMSFAFYAATIWIAYHLTTKISKATSHYDADKKWGIKAGILIASGTSIFLSLVYPLLSGHYINTLAINASIEKRAAYCNENLDESTVCWDAQILRHHGLPVTKKNLTLLNAINGKGSAIQEVESNLILPHKVILELQPAPDTVILFFTKSYSRSFEYHVKQGSLESLMQFTLTKDELALLEPDENNAWAALALHDQDAFIRGFDTSPTSVRNDHNLKFLYALLTGEWQKRSSFGNDYYILGKLAFFVEDGLFIVPDKAISLHDLDKIMSIPASSLPSL